jgi:uncharacterized damage-inducible protein DinB
MGTGEIDRLGILASTMNEPLAQMFRYNEWANATLLDACAGLSDDQLDFAIEGAYGSIRSTLMHYLGSQDVYLSDFRGGVRDKRPWRRGEWPGLTAISAYSEASSAALVECALALTEDAEISFVMELGDSSRALKSVLLVQALQHATEHREQICSMLTFQGVAPPDLSGWAFGASISVVEVIEG